jgi:hypothetical protein
MNKTLEGMVRAYEDGFLSSTGNAHTRADAMRAVLNWLADNVSDEMVIKALEAAVKYMNDNGYPATTPLSGHAADYTRVCLSAALRAAGDGR